MSEYKFVQWGKGIPVDYQRLGQMVSNEQYLKDIVDDTPRGVLAWKSVAGSTYATPTGIAQNVTNLSNIPFDVEENRLISFEFDSGRLHCPANTVEVRFSLLIDNVNTGDVSGTVVVAGEYESPASYTWIPTSALSKGAHTVSAQFVSNNAASSLQIGNLSRCSLIVRDEGPFISASS
jgi:hypothetical protein